jgi:hypothetical protein
MSLQSYTFTQLEAIASHAAEHTVYDTGNSAALIVAAALYDVANRHGWTWLRRPMSLDVSSSTITVMARATNVVSVTTSAAHNLIIGDSVRITGSTATTNSFNGEFIVASVGSTTTFTYTQSGANESATITAAKAIPSFITLPTDFLRAGVVKRRGYGASAQQVTLDQMMEMRLNFLGLSSTMVTWWALANAPQVSNTVSPLMRFEIYPAPTAAQASFLYGTYTRAIPIGTGTAVPDVPVDVLELLAAAVRYQAVLTETSIPDMRVGDYERKLQDAKERDGQRQANLGSTIPSRTGREYFATNVSIR